jgi:2-phosphosulfolactate phosphatase
MEIRILNFVEGARKAEGLSVVIDVFRAFSLECYVYAQNAKIIIPVADVKQAISLKREHQDYILIGEREEKKIEGFDFGNSPSQIMNQDFSGKTIVHTTSAGTHGIVNSINASEVITGSFVNAKAIIKYIKKTKTDIVSLVCMGYSALSKTEEDSLCAEYISEKLKDRNPDFAKMVNTIRSTSGTRFFDLLKAEHCPAEDFNLCLDLNRFNFIIRADKQLNGLIFNRKIEF